MPVFVNTLRISIGKMSYPTIIQCFASLVNNLLVLLIKLSNTVKNSNSFKKRKNFFVSNY